MPTTTVGRNYRSLQPFTPAFSVGHDDSAYACLSNQTLAHEMGYNQGDHQNIEDSGGTAERIVIQSQ